MEDSTAANSAEERKRCKYAALAEAHQLESIAVETMGVYGESTGAILRAIGRRLDEVTGEPREVNWFRQNLAIAIQRGNVFSSLSRYGEVLEGRGSRGPPTPHFVPEGISSSMRDFIFLAFNFEVLECLFFSG